LEVYVGDELRDTIPIVSAQQANRLTIPGIFAKMARQLLMADCSSRRFSGGYIKFSKNSPPNSQMFHSISSNLT